MTWGNGGGGCFLADERRTEGGRETLNKGEEEKDGGGRGDLNPLSPIRRTAETFFFLSSSSPSLKMRALQPIILQEHMTKIVFLRL